VRSEGVSHPFEHLKSPVKSSPQPLSTPPVPRPSPQGTPAGLPSPILRCLSRLAKPLYTLLHAAPAGLRGRGGDAKMPFVLPIRDRLMHYPTNNHRHFERVEACASNQCKPYTRAKWLHKAILSTSHNLRFATLYLKRRFPAAKQQPCLAAVRLAVTSITLALVYHMEREKFVVVMLIEPGADKVKELQPSMPRER
jgi:hypothetical protein